MAEWWIVTIVTYYLLMTGDICYWGRFLVTFCEVKFCYWWRFLRWRSVRGRFMEVIHFHWLEISCAAGNSFFLLLNNFLQKVVSLKWGHRIMWNLPAPTSLKALSSINYCQVSQEYSAGRRILLWHCFGLGFFFLNVKSCHSFLNQQTDYSWLRQKKYGFSISLGDMPTAKT